MVYEDEVDTSEVEVDFDELTDEDVLDDPYDHILEQQELEDFAQDGYFENMEPIGDGFWG